MRQVRGLLGRPALLAISVLGSTALLGVFGAAQDNAARPERKPKLAPQQYKNIKVLTDLPADQLVNTMQTWGTALGVKCEFCHTVSAVGTGWEKDDNPHKQIARDMLLLTRDMNTRHASLEKKVTCYTCHHGRVHPEHVPPGPKPPQGTAAAK
jgi:hypothetical protein